MESFDWFVSLNCCSIIMFIFSCSLVCCKWCLNRPVVSGVTGPLHCLFVLLYPLPSVASFVSLPFSEVFSAASIMLCGIVAAASIATNEAVFINTVLVDGVAKVVVVAVVVSNNFDVSASNELCSFNWHCNSSCSVRCSC